MAHMSKALGVGLLKEEDHLRSTQGLLLDCCFAGLVKNLPTVAVVFASRFARFLDERVMTFL